MGGSASSGVAIRSPDPPARPVVLAVGAAGFVACGALIALAQVSEDLSQPGVRAALACWVTAPYIAAGLVAWRRRPESRLGVLMVVAGFATFVNFLVWSNNDLLFSVGLAAQMLPPVLFLHLFLSFPGGRLESNLDRALVAAAYAAAALTLPAMALGLDAPRNVFAVSDRPEVADIFLRAQLLVVSALLVVGMGVLWRGRRHRRPTRRALRWLVGFFSLGLLMIALLLTAGLFDWAPIQEPIRLSTFVVVGLAPIVFLGGLLEAQLGRGSVARLMPRPSHEDFQMATSEDRQRPPARTSRWPLTASKPLGVGGL